MLKDVIIVFIKYENIDKQRRVAFNEHTPKQKSIQDNYQRAQQGTKQTQTWAHRRSKDGMF
jgi:hypothetical protein